MLGQIVSVLTAPTDEVTRTLIARLATDDAGDVTLTRAEELAYQQVANRTAQALDQTAIDRWSATALRVAALTLVPCQSSLSTPQVSMARRGLRPCSAPTERTSTLRVVTKRYNFSVVVRCQRN
jgi:hypothetical protein